MSIVAKILLYDEAGHVLVMRRSGTHPHYPHEADLPGGEVEEGESIHAGMCRELDEETGIAVSPTSVLLVHERITGEGRKDTLFIATVPNEKPQVTISWEHESYEWVPAAEALYCLDTTDDYMIVAREYLAKQESGKIEVA